jgi:hypothetical protein
VPGSTFDRWELVLQSSGDPKNPPMIKIPLGSRNANDALLQLMATDGNFRSPGRSCICLANQSFRYAPSVNQTFFRISRICFGTKSKQFYCPSYVEPC